MLKLVSLTRLMSFMSPQVTGFTSRCSLQSARKTGTLNCFNVGLLNRRNKLVQSTRFFGQLSNQQLFDAIKNLNSNGALQQWEEVSTSSRMVFMHQIVITYQLLFYRMRNEKLSEKLSFLMTSIKHGTHKDHF